MGIHTTHVTSCTEGCGWLAIHMVTAMRATGKSALPALKRIVETDKNWLTRLNAVKAVEAVCQGTEEGWQILRSGLSDPDSTVRRTANAALNKARPQSEITNSPGEPAIGLSESPAGRRQSADRLAILDFVDSLGCRSQAGSKVTSLIFAELSDRGSDIDLVDRVYLDMIMKERELSDAGFISSELALAAGRIVGATYVLTGRRYLLDGNIRLNAKLIDCKDGSTSGVTIRLGKSESEAEGRTLGAVSNIVDMIVDHMAQSR